MRRIFTATLALFVCLPAAAAALVIEFAGTVSGIVDPDARLDGSVASGTPVTGVYEVDPTPSPIGPFGEVGAARLSFVFGNYRFDAAHDPHTIKLIDDQVVGPTMVDLWSSREFVSPDLVPAIPLELDGAGYEAGLEFFDFTHTEITGSESAPFVVTDLADWSLARLFLSSLVTDAIQGTTIGDLQVQVDLDHWQVVPEPKSGALVVLGLLSLARRRAVQRKT